MQNQIGVTGLGVISSVCRNADEFKKSLMAGKNGVESIDDSLTDCTSTKLRAPIKDLCFKETVGEYSQVAKEFRQRIVECSGRSSEAMRSGILSALEAYLQANLASKKPKQIGIVVAGSNLTQNRQYKSYEKFQDTPEFLSPYYALQFMDTNYLGVLSEIFAVKGEGMTVGGASASGNLAILKGYRLIKLGLVDACMVVGTFPNLSPMELQGFYNIGALGGKDFKDQPKKACRPFDQDHEGFIFGEASGCIILENLKSAHQRNIPILAKLLGGAITLDGNRLPNPNEKGEVRAMETALKRSQVGKDNIDYINAHGSSSPLGDEVEVKAISSVFEKRVSNIWINSTKGLTGHCLNSAGIIEAIATIIQLKEGFVHPNINLDNPIEPEIKFNNSEFSKQEIKFSLSNSFGFGGINSSLIFKKGD
jgi:malonyl-ACP decarboxylase